MIERWILIELNEIYQKSKRIPKYSICVDVCV